MLLRKIPQEKLISARRYANEIRLEQTKNISFAKEIETALTGVDHSIEWTVLDTPAGELYLYIEKTSRNHDQTFYNIEQALKNIVFIYNSVAHPYDSFYLSRIQPVKYKKQD